MATCLIPLCRKRIVYDIVESGSCMNTCRSLIAVLMTYMTVTVMSLSVQMKVLWKRREWNEAMFRKTFLPVSINAKCMHACMPSLYIIILSIYTNSYSKLKYYILYGSCMRYTKRIQCYSSRVEPRLTATPE